MLIFDQFETSAGFRNENGCFPVRSASRRDAARLVANDPDIIYIVDHNDFLHINASSQVGMIIERE